MVVLKAGEFSEFSELLDLRFCFGSRLGLGYGTYGSLFRVIRNKLT